MGKRSYKHILHTGTGASVRVAGSSQHRVAVLIQPHTSGSGTVEFGESPSTFGDGFVVHVSGGALLITRELIGDSIMMPVNVLADVGNVFTVTEIFET